MNLSKTAPFSLMRLFAAATLLLILGSCSSNNPTQPTPAGPAGFHQITGLPTVTTWEKVWGVPGDRVFVMGQNGLVYSSQGVTWDSLNSTVVNDRSLFSAWGTAANNTYFVGSKASVEHIIITPDSTYSLFYDDPILENYNGVDFNAETFSGVKWGLYDIWGSAANDIFAVGYNGTIVHYNGSSWSVTTTGGTSPAWLNSVWGTSDSSVFASGTGGTLLHFDSVSWQVLRTHTFEDLWDVWGLSDTSVYCVGSRGTILRYNGTGFTKMTSPTTNSLYSIWGTDEDNLFAVGWGGKILHYDGTTWSDATTLTGFGLLSIWGTGSNDIYAVGQTALHFDGTSWSPQVIRHEPDFADIWAGSRSGAREVVAVGTGGTILKSPSGETFTWMTINGGKLSTDLNGVAGVSDTAAFIVGDAGLILKRDETDLTNWVTAQSGIAVDLNAVSALSKNLAYAVGAGGTILRWDGSVWNSETSPTSQDLKDVWMAQIGSDTLVFVVGNAGTASWYDGTWHSPSTSTSENLRSIIGSAAGDVWAVGDNGTLLHFISNAWTPVSPGTSENLISVWNDNAGHLFITGESGRVFQYNISAGTTAELSTAIGFDLNGVFGFSSTDFFAVGAFNHILHYRL